MSLRARTSRWRDRPEPGTNREVGGGATVSGQEATRRLARMTIRNLHPAHKRENRHDRYRLSPGRGTPCLPQGKGGRARSEPPGILETLSRACLGIGFLFLGRTTGGRPAFTSAVDLRRRFDRTAGFLQRL